MQLLLEQKATHAVLLPRTCEHILMSAIGALYNYRMRIERTVQYNESTVKIKFKYQMQISFY